ncbi:hypothetical protein EON81_12475 [bacterium]|nr:MAG: hypothetical protein EON81_12475 [bacterium]
MAIIIDNPVLERRLKRRAASQGISEGELVERLLLATERTEAKPSVEEVAEMFAHNRGTHPLTKEENNELFEPLG